MFYAKLKSDGTLDKYPYTLTDLRRDNSNTSFPQDIDDQIAETFGIVKVEPSMPPTQTHTVNLIRSAEKRNNKWVEIWSSNPATSEEIEKRTQIKTAEIRQKRNKLLDESDWTQMSDVSLNQNKKNEWSSYRQLLRDLTNQPDFPWSISWPEKPAN